MATTTTIRVSTETRDRLNAMAAREGGSAGEIIAKLVYAADDEQLLADAEADFEKLARDPQTLAAYHREAREIESGFGDPAPAW